MNKVELIELIRNDESSGVEFKRGTTTRDATREEEERLYQQSGRLRYGCKPVPGSAVEMLDPRRLRDYFARVVGGDAPADDDVDGWRALLVNLDLATAAAGQVAATIDGMLLFGSNPKRFLPQSGIRAVCYTGEEPDYAVRADEDLKGPLVPLGARDGSLVELGLVDQAWDFVRRNTTPTARLEGARRIDRWDYPGEVVREAVGNALVHRDYSIAGTDIMLAIFSNRLEVVSPGRLPNTVTPEGIRSGTRYARNQTLVNVMRDYGYVEARGMGVRIIASDHPGHEGAQRYRARPRGGRAPLYRPVVEKNRGRGRCACATTGRSTERRHRASRRADEQGSAVPASAAAQLEELSARGRCPRGPPVPRGSERVGQIQLPGRLPVSPRHRPLRQRVP